MAKLNENQKILAFAGGGLLLCLAAGAGMAVASQPVLANVSAECRQEAEEYGIPPEQMDDYVTGCVLSRGGEYAPDPAVQDTVAPDETMTTDDAGMGGNYSSDAGMGGSSTPE